MPESAEIQGAQADMARLRRRLARAEKSGLGPMLGSLLYRPRQLRRALTPPATDVAAVRRITGKGRLRQIAEQAGLVLRYRLPPAEYYAGALFVPGRLRRAGDWMSQRQIDRLMRALLPEEHGRRIEDKAWFAEHCRRHDLPHPRVLGIWSPAAEARPSFRESFDASAAGGGVLCKPIDGFGGAGVTLLRSRDGAAWDLADEQGGGADLSWDDLRRRMGDGALRFLCQQRVVNHPDLAAFGESPLHTVRVMTLKRDNDFEPMFTVWRIGARDGLVDNFARGGIGAPIDPASGRVGRGVTAATSSLPHSLAETAQGVRFEGLVLPLWRDVLDLACRVHRSLPEGPFMCHDIAITPEGAMTMEINHIWSVKLVQKPLGDGLGATAFVGHALAALNEARR